MSSSLPKTYVAFQGGGALGMAHLGAWQVLARRFQIVGTAGTSAGSIVAALCAAGYIPSQAKRVFLDLEWFKYVKPMTLNNWVDLLVKRQGWSDGELFYQKMKELLAENFIHPPQKITFETLYRETNIFLVIIACDLNNATATPVHFDIYHESKVDVAFAVRASISIPALFVPVPRRDIGQILVDGGLLLNLPVEPLKPLAQKDQTPLVTVRFKQSVVDGMPEVLDVVKRSLGVMLSPGNLPPQEITQDPNYIDIVVDVTGFKSSDFNLSKQQKDTLFHRGAEAATQALLEYDLRMERLKPKMPFSISVRKSQRQRNRSIYMSRSWRRDEQNLANYICQMLDNADFRLVGDTEDQDRYSEDRIRSIMSSCGGVVAILSDRTPDPPSPYILKEIRMAQGLGLPCLIVAEATVKLERDLAESALYMPVGVANPDISSLQRRIEKLKEEWKAPAQVPYIFFAASFNTQNKQTNQEVQQLIQNITGMLCVMGDEIKESQVVQKIITDQISNAKIVIADLSGDSPISWNVNTCVEAGIARGTNRELHLLCEGPRRKPPFMFYDRQIHFYDDPSDLQETIHRLVFPYRRWTYKPDALM